MLKVCICFDVFSVSKRLIWNVMRSLIPAKYKKNHVLPTYTLQVLHSKWLCIEKSNKLNIIVTGRLPEKKIFWKDACFWTVTIHIQMLLLPPKEKSSANYNRKYKQNDNIVIIMFVPYEKQCWCGHNCQKWHQRSGWTAMLTLFDLWPYHIIFDNIPSW